MVHLDELNSWTDACYDSVCCDEFLVNPDFNVRAKPQTHLNLSLHNWRCVRYKVQNATLILVFDLFQIKHKWTVQGTKVISCLVLCEFHFLYES